MKVTVLLENTALSDSLAADHGLSLYLETPRHRLLFDMGPSAAFAANADALGVDLARVDLAVLSHGHADHSGGLETFLQRNSHAPVYLHRGAFASHWSCAGDAPRFISPDPALHRYDSRFIQTEGVLRIDEELTLFDGVADEFGALSASASLFYEKPDGTRVPDDFRHEHNLLLTAGGKTVLVSGCAHRGIVNILRRATALLGRAPDAVISGFHLFQLKESDPASDELIRRTGQALAEFPCHYYTGHCTGPYALEKLREILPRRLTPISGGFTAEL